MSLHALALVLTAAVLHAVWNIAAKRVQGGSQVFVFCYALLSAVLWLPIGAIVLARSDTSIGWPLLLASALSGLFHNLYGLALQAGYDTADLGVVYPVARGTGPLITMLFAIAVLGERPGLLGVAGGLVVVAGVAVVATARAPEGHPTQRLSPYSGIWWGALTGMAIAAYTLWDDHAMTELALLPIPYFALTATWQTLLMAPALRGQGRTLRRIWHDHWREVAIIAVLSPLAYVLVLQAMTTTPVALVAPARESSIVVGALLAWWLFKESRPARKLLGAVVVLVGIALIAA